MVQESFESWVDRLVERQFGGRFQALADRVGLTFSAFKRSVRKGSTSIDTLLRLAIATGLHPAEVFRVAGKSEIHELATQLYGPAAELPLSDRAKQLALAFDSLQDEGAKKWYAESLLALAKTAQPIAQNGGTSVAKTSAGIGKSKKRGTR